MHKCLDCLRELPDSAFYHHARRAGQRDIYCRDCAAARQRRYRSTERGRANAAAAALRYYRRKRDLSGVPREPPAAA